MHLVIQSDLCEWLCQFMHNLNFKIDLIFFTVAVAPLRLGARTVNKVTKYLSKATLLKKSLVLTL